MANKMQMITLSVVTHATYNPLLRNNSEPEWRENSSTAESSYLLGCSLTMANHACSSSLQAVICWRTTVSHHTTFNDHQ